MQEITKVISGGIEYTKEDLMKMDPVLLRALLRERTHHNIEVPLYPSLLKWEGNPITGFGQQAQMVFDVWRERGFTEDAPDIEWVKELLAIAEKIRAGEKFEWDKPFPTPFTDEEMAVVNKLIYGRHSIRNWIDKPVPDEMIEKILEAGRAAPIGCNLDELRFLVLRDPEEIKKVRADILTKNCVLILVFHDMRIHKVVGQDVRIPHNAGFDAAAAADHMLLIAHALGLGAVWLSQTLESGPKYVEQSGLPDYLKFDLDIAVGWTALGTIKSKRMPLADMMPQRNA